MEELLREKEKELERVEEQGCALVQNKTDEACAIVMETLQCVNHTWANLDHLVSSSVLFSLCLSCGTLVTPIYSASTFYCFILLFNVVNSFSNISKR